jgi:hypothetical protein
MGSERDGIQVPSIARAIVALQCPHGPEGDPLGRFLLNIDVHPHLPVERVLQEPPPFGSPGTLHKPHCTLHPLVPHARATKAKEDR